MIVVYIIINNVNGKVYIGSTNSITDRFGNHKRTLNNGIHHNEHLQNAWNKYGSDSFEFKTLMVCPDKERNHCEQMFMDLYDSQNHDCGYNIKDAEGHFIADETKFKISEALTGKQKTEEHKQKISKSLTGRTRSEESIKKQSESMSGENNQMYGKIGENCPNWKDYARIVKGGFCGNKQQYTIRFNGKVIKTSISIDKLEKWFKDNYPNKELVIDAKN